MTWSTIPAVVAGVPLPKATWLDPVTTDLNVLGNAWTDDTLSRSSTAIWTTTGASVGNGTLVSRYRLAGKTLDWLMILTFGSTTAPGSGQFTFTYPAGVSPLNAGSATADVRYFDSSGANTYNGLGILNAATVNLQAGVTAGALSLVNATTPMTWTTADVVSFLVKSLEVA